MRVLKKILKWTAWIVGTFTVLLLAALTLLVWIMTPARLTPIVERVANDALDARVDIGRVELTLWHTFPHLTVDVDSLAVVSKAFDKLSPGVRSVLPAGSDTLLRVGRFHGSVNVPALLAAKVHLYDIELESSRINVVALDSIHANYDIFPASEDVHEDDGIAFVPDVSLSRFTITDSLLVSYRSVADSCGVSVVIARDSVVENADPDYLLRLASTVRVEMPGEVMAGEIGLDLGGTVKWDSSEPMLVDINDFGLNVGTGGNGWIRSEWNAELDFDEPLTLKKLDFSVGPFSPLAALGLLSDSIRSRIGPLDTDMMVSVSGRLTVPFRPMTDTLPAMAVNVKIPRCRAVYDKMLSFDRIESDIDVDLPASVDSAVVTVKKLELAGMGGALAVEGRLSDMMDNPSFDGKVVVESRLGALPRKLLAMLPDSSTLSGRVRLDTDMRCSLSDFTVDNFHRLLLRGTLSVDDLEFDAPHADMACHTRHTEVKLGTAGSFVAANNVKIDSLLTMSVSSDTLSLALGGMDIRLKNARMGAGCLNRPPSSDSTVVIPFGGILKADRVSYTDMDSSIIRLGDIAARIALRRYEHNARLPHMKIEADAGRIFFTDRKNFMGLRKSHFDLDAYIKPKRERRVMTAEDSVRMAARRAGREAERAMHVGADSLDLTVDESTGRLLRRLQLTGRLTAERGGMFSPYFPLRNRISDFDVEFSTDSLVLHNVRYRCGKSDFTVSGSVRNIRRALTRGAPIELDWKLHSDSLNVNEIVQAFYVGADYAAKDSPDMDVTDAVSDADLDRLADGVDADSIAAVLIPLNLEARLDVRADNVVYSDMDMHDFRGELLVSEGAINLHDLRAASEMGSVRLNALYSAPDKEEIRFGMGLDLEGIDVKKFIGMVPAVDSLMPLLKSFEGVIDANIAATADIDSTMNIVMPSLDAVIKLAGRELVLLDAETFRTIAKWLMFKNKKRNVIEHMEAEMLVRNSTVQLFPFVFDFDRYRLAVMGSNDLDLNFKYHISVLKSPLPFKFGINLSGNPDDMKVRLGGSKYKPGSVGESLTIVDNTRVNLLKEIDNVFRKGSRAARLGALKVDGVGAIAGDAAADTISAADSLVFIKEGLLPAPPPAVSDSLPDNSLKASTKKSKKEKKKKN
ncbi:AsmA-like C-terminal region-containing protein [uncultured Muribaculum sp.]|uniref:AsmA-like C-terminal region-containing protein n=1 Tax=uncultured Muribaculum sp. TaxID=1918613 RepID=UPI0026041B8E|nr:AsmA-like C-terminal region-containing protein [uncultured Muribaculum sp.]